MVESSLGTFRVEKELWTKFQELAKSGGSNASKAIVGFIQACIDGSIDIQNYTSIKPKPKAEADNLDEVVGAYLDKNLDARIDRNLDACIHSYLDKNLDQLMSERLDKIDIQKMVKESIEVALEPITVSVSEAENYTRSQIEKVREELMSGKKLSAIATTSTTDSTPSPQQPAIKTRQPRKSSEIVPPSRKAAIAMTIDSMSWGEFHALVGIDMPKVKNRSNADIALDWAKGMGIPVYLTNPNVSGWDYNGDVKNFIVKRHKP